MNTPEKFSIECVEDFVYLVTDEYNNGTSMSKRVRLIDLRTATETDNNTLRSLVASYVQLFKRKTVD